MVRPGGELQSTVVGRVKQTRLGEGSSEESQLAQAYGPGFTLDPSVGGHQLWWT